MAGATLPRNGEYRLSTRELECNRSGNEEENAVCDLAADVPLQVWLHEEFADFRQALVTDIRELLLNTTAANSLDRDTLPKEVHSSGCKALCSDDRDSTIKTLLPTSDAHSQLEMTNRTTLPVEIQHAPTRDVDIPGALPSGNPPTLHPRHPATSSSQDTGWEASYTGVVPSRETMTTSNLSRASTSRGSTSSKDDEEREKSKTSITKSPTLRVGENEPEPLDQEPYDVTNYYHKTGCSQAVARHETFEKVTLAIIAVNALYIGVDAEFNDADALFNALWPFVVFENLFCIFFSFEWAIRFAAFRRKRDGLKDFWFKFDSALVLLMVLETWLMPAITALTGSSGGGGMPVGPLRLLRLLRLTRMARLMRSLPELLTMIKGMKASARAVGSSLFMVAMLIYVFAIVLHMALNDDERMDDYFGTLGMCMWTLLVDGTLMDSTGVVLAKLRDNGEFTSALALIVFMAFILLSAMTVMNMLIGVLCEVVSTVAQNEKDEAAIRVMKESILVQLKRFDVNNNGCISMEELTDVMQDPQAREVLTSLEVDIGYLMELQLLLYSDKTSEVRIQTIMDLMLASRGDMPTSVAHLVRSQAFIRWVVVTEVNRLQKSVETSIKEAVWQTGRTICLSPQAPGQSAASRPK